MRVIDHLRCETFPCEDVRHERHAVSAIPVDPEQISVVLISEAVAPEARDWYEAGDDALYAQTTVQAFRDAGEDVSSMRDIRDLGVHVTSAVKCAKTAYGIATATVASCSTLLEAELALFPRTRSLLLMGDVAIKAMNTLARRVKEPRVIPAGSTYKLRGPDYRFRTIRAFPSYLQAGPSFFIERSKREMIAEDIAAALRHARATA